MFLDKVLFNRNERPPKREEGRQEGTENAKKTLISFSSTFKERD